MAVLVLGIVANRLPQLRSKDHGGTPREASGRALGLAGITIGHKAVNGYFLLVEGIHTEFSTNLIGPLGKEVESVRVISSELGVHGRRRK